MNTSRYLSDSEIADATAIRPRPPGHAAVGYHKVATFSTHHRLPEFLRFNRVAYVEAIEFLGHGFADSERYEITYVCFEPANP